MSKHQFIILFIFICSFVFAENLNDIKNKVSTTPLKPEFWSEWAIIEKFVLSARHNKKAGLAGGWAKICSLEDDYVFDKIILVERQLANINSPVDYYYLMFIKSQSTGALAGVAGIDPKDGLHFTFAGVDLELNAWILSKDDALQCFSEYNTDKRYAVNTIKAVYIPKRSRHDDRYHWFWAVAVADSRVFNREDVFLINPTARQNRGSWFSNVGLGGTARINRVKSRQDVDKVINFFSNYKYAKNRSIDENGDIKYYNPIEWEEVQ